LPSQSGRSRERRIAVGLANSAAQSAMEIARGSVAVEGLSPLTRGLRCPQRIEFVAWIRWAPSPFIRGLYPARPGVGRSGRSLGGLWIHGAGGGGGWMPRILPFPDPRTACFREAMSDPRKRNQPCGSTFCTGSPRSR
jgi:hypothetical protein